MKVKVRHRGRLIIVIYMFMLIFYPPIISINLLHIATAIAFLYIGFHIKLARNLWNKTKLSYIVLSFGFVGIYLLTVALLQSNSPDDAFVYFRYVVEIIPCCFMVSIFFYKNEYNLDDFMDALLLVGTIQGALALIAFLKPEFQAYTLQKAISYGFNESKFNSFFNRRYYGFAYNLVTYTPLVQASLFIYSIHKTISGKTKYVVFAPLLFFSAVLNARSPILLIVAGFAMMLIIGGNVKRSVLLVVVSTMFLAASIYVLLKLETISYRAFLWLTEGLREIYSLITLDPSSAYISNLRSLAQLLPKGFSILVGRGTMVLGSATLSSTAAAVSMDNGYFNYIWAGGLFFLFAINLIFLRIENKIISSCRWNDSMRVLAIHLLLTTIVFNFKMPIFLVNEYSILVLLIYCASAILFPQNDNKG